VSLSPMTLSLETLTFSGTGRLQSLLSLTFCGRTARFTGLREWEVNSFSCCILYARHKQESDGSFCPVSSCIVPVSSHLRERRRTIVPVDPHLPARRFAARERNGVPAHTHLALWRHCVSLEKLTLSNHIGIDFVLPLARPRREESAIRC
jgi:hypothetical protein